MEAANRIWFYTKKKGEASAAWVEGEVQIMEADASPLPYVRMIPCKRVSIGYLMVTFIVKVVELTAGTT